MTPAQWEKWTFTAITNGHVWGIYKSAVIIESCCFCGLIRRADDKNTPCKGPVPITLRTEATK